MYCNQCCIKSQHFEHINYVTQLHQPTIMLIKLVRKYLVSLSRKKAILQKIYYINVVQIFSLNSIETGELYVCTDVNSI